MHTNYTAIRVCLSKLEYVQTDGRQTDRSHKTFSIKFERVKNERQMYCDTSNCLSTNMIFMLLEETFETNICDRLKLFDLNIT